MCYAAHQATASGQSASTTIRIAPQRRALAKLGVYTQNDIDGEFSKGSPIKVLVVDSALTGRNHVAHVTVSTVGNVPAGTWKLSPSKAVT